MKLKTSFWKHSQCCLGVFLPIVIICLFVARNAMAEDTYFKKVKYVYQEGEKQKEKDARLTFTSDSLLLTHEDDPKKEKYADIKIANISKVVYEKSSHPRWKTAVFLTPWALFSKGKKHWLTIQYQKAEGGEDFALMHLDKKNYQMIIATMEAKTGKQVEKMIED